MGTNSCWSHARAAMWKRMIRTPWSAAKYPATKEGVKQIRAAVKRLSKQDKSNEYRWNELIQTDGTFVYVIEWRPAS